LLRRFVILTSISFFEFWDYLFRLFRRVLIPLFRLRLFRRFFVSALLSSVFVANVMLAVASGAAATVLAAASRAAVAALAVGPQPGQEEDADVGGKSDRSHADLWHGRKATFDPTAASRSCRRSRPILNGTSA
jgi:hypothetical protein